MTKLRSITFIRPTYKKFRDIKPILKNFFETKGKICSSSNAVGEILWLKVNIDPEKIIPNKPSEPSIKKLYNKIRSCEFTISICKHNLLVIDIEITKLKMTTKTQGFFKDVIERIESSIKGMPALRNPHDITKEEPISISVDTGRLYTDDNTGNVIVEHMERIEKRYTDILLDNLYGQFIKSPNIKQKQGFSKSLANIREAISEYSNKLHDSPNHCSLVNADKNVIETPVLFLQKLCNYLHYKFTQFSPEESDQEEIEKQFKDNNVNKLLANEESYHIEYKSTLIHDLETEKPNKVLTDKVTRAIACFMNSYDGGIVVVGYNETKKEIVGIEQDFRYLGKNKNWDGWSLLLSDKCKSQIGYAPTSSYTRIEKINYENHILAKILVKPAKKPQFYQKKFFPVKINNQTSNLDGDDRQDYIDDRFNDEE